MKKEPGNRLTTRLYKNCYALPIRCFTSEDGISIHGGGLCCDGVWLKESGLFPSAQASYEFNPDSARYIDEDVIFMGCMSPVWGHAITDCMKHLWWFSTEEYLKKHTEKKLYYWGTKPLGGNFLELVRLAGVDVTKLHFVDEILLFRSIIVPDISFNYTEGWASKEYLDTIDHIVSTIKPYRKEGVQKLFLSERESNRLWGVKSIEKVARSAGYKVYYPGEHSLHEQISVLQSASDILSFESSVGHNTVFCQPRIKVTMLRKESYLNKYQPIINKLRGFDVNTVDASLSIMNDKRYPYAGPFFVYPNDSVCQAVFHSSGPSLDHNLSDLFPKTLFKRYIQYNLWGSEDGLAHKLVFSDAQAKSIAQEITKYRERHFNRINKVFRFIPMPHRIKNRMITKICKYLVRHLI